MKGKTLDVILSYDWIGIVIAVSIGLLGYGLFSLGRRIRRKAGKWILSVLGCLILILSLPLFGGSVYHVCQVIRFTQKYPPPGKIYEVDGVKLHIWVEGINVQDDEGHVSPTVIFIPGGYSSGIEHWHLHKEIAKETRSILFDRAGTGWSQRSPHPRHVKRDALELRKLLDAAGEGGPFVLVGHSVGGFLAYNFAFYHRDYVAGLVILDGTTPITDEDVKVIPLYALYEKASAIAKLFSATRFLPSIMEEGAEDPDSSNFAFEPLREVWHLRQAVRIKAQSSWASAAAIEAMAKNRDLQVTDQNALGSIPLLAIYSPEAIEGSQNSVQQVAKLSRLGTLIYPPEGSTHMFPLEFPEFCLEKVREMIAIVMEDDKL